MIEETLQLWLDQALATCRQRWVLSITAVAAVTTATLVITIGAAAPQGIALTVGAVTGLAIVAVAGSGSHVGSVVIALVGLTWVFFVDDVATPKAMGVAGCLYVFHALLALMAATRHTSPLERRILMRWLARSVGVLAATGAVWLGVVALEGRNIAGGANLTAIAVVAIALAVMAIRHQILRPRTGRR